MALRLVVGGALIALALSSTAHAADICEAIALRDVPDVNSPESILAKGQRDTAITQYNVDKATGRTTFCSHGGSCYPTHVVVNAQKIEALKLTNCSVDMKHPFNMGDEISYPVEVLRSKISVGQLRKDDVDNKLLEMGLCSACGSNVAEMYVSKPKSKCAQLTKKAFEGNPVATKELVDFPGYCKAFY